MIHKDKAKEYIRRAELCYNRLQNDVLADTITFSATYCKTKEPVRWEDREKGEFVVAEEGVVWGRGAGRAYLSTPREESSRRSSLTAELGASAREDRWRAFIFSGAK